MNRHWIDWVQRFGPIMLWLQLCLCVCVSAAAGSSSERSAERCVEFSRSAVTQTHRHQLAQSAHRPGWRRGAWHPAVFGRFWCLYSSLMCVCVQGQLSDFSKRSRSAKFRLVPKFKKDKNNKNKETCAALNMPGMTFDLWPRPVTVHECNTRVCCVSSEYVGCGWSGRLAGDALSGRV